MSNVTTLGWEKTFHQPSVPETDAGMIDVRKSPIVGTSQSSPIAASTMLTGALTTTRPIRDATL